MSNLVFLSSLGRMSKFERSDKWFVRIDGDKLGLQLQCVELSRQEDVLSLLSFFHKGSKKENPHCHIVIQVKKEIQKQSFALRIKSLFKQIKKRSDYALTVWDGVRTSGAVSYMFHESEVEMLYNKGFTEEELSFAKQENDRVQVVVDVNKERASNKLVDKAIEYFMNKKTEYGYVNKRTILLYMVEECKKGENYYPGSFMLKKFVEEVELRLLDDADVGNYVESLYHQLWRD